MPLILSAIPWRLVAIIGVVAGLFFGAVWVTSQLKKIGVLESANAQLKSDLAASRELPTIIVAGEKKKEDIRHKADHRRKVIQSAPPSDDAPLAPVLRDELNSLRPDPEAEPAGNSS